jgi:hypothetical protein
VVFPCHQTRDLLWVLFPCLWRTAVEWRGFREVKKVDGGRGIGVDSDGEGGREGWARRCGRFRIPKMGGIRGHGENDLDALRSKVSKSLRDLGFKRMCIYTDVWHPRRGRGLKTLLLEVGMEFRKSSGALVGKCQEDLQEGGRWVGGGVRCEWEAVNFPGGFGSGSF